MSPIARFVAFVILVAGSAGPATALDPRGIDTRGFAAAFDRTASDLGVPVRLAREACVEGTETTCTFTASRLARALVISARWRKEVRTVVFVLDAEVLPVNQQIADVLIAMFAPGLPAYDQLHLRSALRAGLAGGEAFDPWPAPSARFTLAPGEDGRRFLLVHLDQDPAVAGGPTLAR